MGIVVVVRTVEICGARAVFGWFADYLVGCAKSCLVSPGGLSGGDGLSGEILSCLPGILLISSSSSSESVINVDW